MTSVAPVAVEAGERMHALAADLFPFCRSITGNGVRATLRELERRIPLEIHEVPSGTQVLDWVVPDEWNIADAFIATAEGERLVDFRASNLHVVSYSEPVRAEMRLAELEPHLHTHSTTPSGCRTARRTTHAAGASASRSVSATGSARARSKS